MAEIPVIDLTDADAAKQMDAACRVHGFFVVRGHGIDADLRQSLDRAARDFFALPDHDKAAIAMPLGGRAWRGWFPPGGELTSGVPDGKEGIYFGRELDPDDQRCLDGRPLHGQNLFPAPPSQLGPLVLEWMDRCAALGHHILTLVATGLGLDTDWFRRSLTTDPTLLFRIFHYPPRGGVEGAEWGVQEHTDYGLLTMLATDGVGGLEVGTDDGWVAVPPMPDAFVCNIGDMLERMTGGVYRSTPHRVRIPETGRLSFPFFFDPSWDAEILPVPGLGDVDRPRPARWDGRSVFDFEGTYGEYLTAKVAKVFPELWSASQDSSGS